MNTGADVVALVDEGLGNSSYLLGLADRRAVVVDPARDPAPYLAEADRRGWSIGFSVETHLHADFISGSRELAARDARVVAPAAAGLEFPSHGLGDGDEVDLGGLRLRGLATPGHSPEHLAFLLLDGDRPLALFSGGSLLVGAVARTDLVSPDQTEPMARALWQSLQQRVLSLPEDVAVYPTHGAGSFCSPPAGGERATTIGRERATNPLLGAPDEDTFVKMLLRRLGSYPPYFLRLRERNRKGPRVYGTGQPGLAPLAPDEVWKMSRDGAEVVDVRPVRAFAAGHVPGSVSNPLRPQFATWLGWLIRDDVPLVFVRDLDQDPAAVVRQALGIGYERFAGELAGGVEAWTIAGFPVARLDVVNAADVTGPVVDVRQDAEFIAGHLPGARHVELGELPSTLGGLALADISVMCGHGERAATAASLLQRAGWRNVRVVLGGPHDWAAANGPLITAR